MMEENPKKLVQLESNQGAPTQSESALPLR